MGYFDRYGNWQGDIASAPGKKVPYIVSEEGDKTYICYTDDAVRAIQRITKTSSEGTTTTTIENAVGSWEDRATLTYYPPNQAIPGAE